MSAPFVNRGLFRDHYLLGRLPAMPDWVTDAAAHWAVLRAIVDAVEPAAPGMNEATLEQALVRPVLEWLGFDPQTWVEKQQTGGYAPDYTVFRSPADRAGALARLEASAFYEGALCLVEAKAWTVDLDRASGRERSPMAQRALARHSRYSAAIFPIERQ